MPSKPHIDDELGLYKSRIHIELCDKWAKGRDDKRLLKTDLREEAYGKDEVLFSLSKYGKNIRIWGVDIEEAVVRLARERRDALHLTQEYVTADVRQLPFGDNSFDIILSTSTLDHFSSKNDLFLALRELNRVLSADGTFILTINNRLNVNFVFWLFIERLMRRRPYPVNFYTPHQLRQICAQAGWRVLEEDFIVHIISPMNSLLLLLRRFMPVSAVEKMAKFFVRIAQYLYKSKATKKYTGWFIALKCIKVSPNL